MILVSKFLVLKHDLGVCQNTDSGHQTQRFLFWHWGCSTNWTAPIGKGPKKSYLWNTRDDGHAGGEEGLCPVKQTPCNSESWCPRTGSARIWEPWGSWPSSLDFLLWNSKKEQHYRKRHIDILRDEGGKALVNSKGKTWSHVQSLRKWNNHSGFKGRRKIWKK